MELTEDLKQELLAHLELLESYPQLESFRKIIYRIFYAGENPHARELKAAVEAKINAWFQQPVS